MYLFSFLSGVAFTLFIELLGLQALLEPLRGPISFALDVLSLAQSLGPN